MISFSAYGHKNILATHANTYEFILGNEMTMKGDCIVGVRCRYNSKDARSFAKENMYGRIRIIYKGKVAFSDDFQVNPGFCSDEEIVIRKSSFVSDRTLGVFCQKAAKDFPRQLICALKNEDEKYQVVIEAK